MEGRAVEGVAAVVAEARAEAADGNVFRMKTTANQRASHANRAGNRRTRCSLTAAAQAAPHTAYEESV